MDKIKSYQIPVSKFALVFCPEIPISPSRRRTCLSQMPPRCIYPLYIHDPWPVSEGQAKQKKKKNEEEDSEAEEVEGEEEAEEDVEGNILHYL